jgi:hypothetical protein
MADSRESTGAVQHTFCIGRLYIINDNVPANPLFHRSPNRCSLTGTLIFPSLRNTFLYDSSPGDILLLPRTCRMHRFGDRASTSSTTSPDRAQDLPCARHHRGLLYGRNYNRRSRAVGKGSRSHVQIPSIGISPQRRSLSPHRLGR